MSQLRRQQLRKNNVQFLLTFTDKRSVKNTSQSRQYQFQALSQSMLWWFFFLLSFHFSFIVMSEVFSLLSQGSLNFRAFTDSLSYHSLEGGIHTLQNVKIRSVLTCDFNAVRHL